MEKKTYSKPGLKTRKIELGVFGTYGNGNPDGGRGGGNAPLPVDVIRDLNLHME